MVVSNRNLLDSRGRFSGVIYVSFREGKGTPIWDDVDVCWCVKYICFAMVKPLLDLWPGTGRNLLMIDGYFFWNGPKKNWMCEFPRVNMNFWTSMGIYRDQYILTLPVDLLLVASAKIATFPIQMLHVQPVRFSHLKMLWCQYMTACALYWGCYVRQGLLLWSIQTIWEMVKRVDEEFFMSALFCLESGSKRWNAI